METKTKMTEFKKGDTVRIVSKPKMDYFLDIGDECVVQESDEYDKLENRLSVRVKPLNRPEKSSGYNQWVDPTTLEKID